MKLYNNTPVEVFYGISAPGEGDCGTINAGDTADNTFYDNTKDVTVTFSGLPSGEPLKVSFNDTGTGKVVTVGLYFE